MNSQTFVNPAPKSYGKHENRDDVNNVPECTVHNAPMVKFVYKDPTTKGYKCVVAVLMFGGVELKNTKFDVLKMGGQQVLQIKYTWPAIFLDPKALFADEKLDDNHPKILAMKKALEKYTGSVDELPTGIIKVKLPTEMKYDPTSATWKKTLTQTEDGANVLILEFDAITNSYAH